MNTPMPPPPPRPSPTPPGPPAPLKQDRGRLGEAIFLSALEMTGDERAAFVSEQCGGDAALRAEVEELLAADAAQLDFLHGAAGDAFKPEESGEMIGHYKLREEIGEGGFGTVWVADQEQPVRRRVALKIIKMGMDTKDVIARFEAERQALAMMDHPNIAKVFDAGATKFGRPFFVMELVKGMAITKYCDEAGLTTRERLALFGDVCSAINHAHQKGIIHRDIKPSNVMITLHGDKPVVKVIDFGIAKATQGKIAEHTVYTQFQQMVGTPAYMSPEQAGMSGLDVDTRSDIYALGVLLYELLIGKPPFDGQSLMDAGYEEMRRIIREVEPVKPSSRLTTIVGEERTQLAKSHRVEPEKIGKLVEPDLDWIVMKAIDKDRTRRYETANAFAQDIRRFLADEPVSATPPSAGYQFRKFARRNKAALRVAAAIAAVLVAATVVSTWQSVRATRAKQDALSARQQAETNEKKAIAAQASEAAQRQTADEQREKAQAQELAARQQAYASDMNLAQQALAMNNLGRAQSLLNRHKPQPGQPDFRGWEWRYLWGQSRSDALFKLTGQRGTISSLAVSPDGRWIASGQPRWIASRQPLAIFDWQTKQQVTADPGRMSGFYVAFSPRSPWIAFPMETDGSFSIRLWDIVSGQVVKDLPLAGRSGRLAFSADGKTLVTSTQSPDSQITFWSVPEGEKLKSHSIGPVSARGMQAPLALARDLSVAAYATDDEENVFQVIDLLTGQQRWTARFGGHPFTSFAFSPDGRILASGSSGNGASICLWDVATGRQIGRPLEFHRAWISELVFWPDGKTMASSSADQTIRLWDLTDPENVRPIRTLQGHKQEVWSLALTPDNRYLLSGSKDGELLVWDTAAARREKGPVRLAEPVWAWRFAPDGKSVLTLDHQGRLMRRTGDTFKSAETLIEVGTNAYGGAISADGRLAAVGSTNGMVRVWDLQQRALLSEFSVATGKVVPIRFLEKAGRLFVYREDDSSIHEWDLAKMSEVRSWVSLMDGTGIPPSLPAIGDEQWTLVVQAGGSTLFRNTLTGEERPSDRKLHWFDFATISPDGKHLADAHGSGFVRLWDSESGTVRSKHTFARFMLGAHSVAFSPDSKRLAAGSSGHESIRLWDIESKQELLTLDSPGLIFWKTEFSPDGNVLSARDESGILHLWRAPSREDIAAIESREKAENKKP
jgi:eukaryotic-like serine/threonine-protein kinase